MDGGNIGDDQRNLGNQQITDKNIATVLQEAITQVAFEGTKNEQTGGNSNLEHISQGSDINLNPDLERLILEPSDSQSQMLHHEQTGFEDANRVLQAQNEHPQQNEQVLNQSDSMYDPVIRISQQESTSYCSVYKEGFPVVEPKTKAALKQSNNIVKNHASCSDIIQQLSQRNEKLTDLNFELQEKLLQQIKDTESGTKEIARVTKEHQEQIKQNIKLNKRNKKLAKMLTKLREDLERLKKNKGNSRGRRRSSVRSQKEKHDVEESVIEDPEDDNESDNGSEKEDFDDPDFEAENVQESESDEGEKDILKEEQQDSEEITQLSPEKDGSSELPKLKKGSPKKPFKCGLCCASYKTKGFLKAHQTRAHYGTPEKRGRRTKKVESPDGDESQVDDDKLEKNKCKLCSAQFKKSCHLYRHEREVHGVHSLNRRNKIRYIEGTDVYVVPDAENDQSEPQTAENVPEKDSSVSEEQAENSLPNELPSDLEELKKLPKIKVKKGFRCNICEKIFTQSCHLRRHERVVHRGERFFPCDICKKMFPDRSGLKEHMKIHSDEKEYSCGICGKAYKYRQKLQIHELTHSGKKPYMCAVCGKSYASKSYLKEHEALHTGVKAYRCKYCPKSFAQSSALKIHEKIHTGEKNHRCKHCGWAFITMQKMREHEYTHTGERPCQCTYCPKSFRTAVALKSHERLHTGERPYRCTICGKAFTQHPHLKSHILIHTGERPHKCKHCGKGFMTRGHLASHESVHTGLKPHKCDKCDKSFAKGNHLVRHMRIHTGEKPFVCSHCGRGFSRSELLRSHEKQQHGIEHEKRTYPKLIMPTKEEFAVSDSGILQASPEISQSIATAALDAGQQVIYHNIQPVAEQQMHDNNKAHLGAMTLQHVQQQQQQQQPQQHQQQQQQSTTHVVIPGLGQQLYQESLARSKQDPSGMVPVGPVDQYWTSAQVSQYMGSFPNGQ